MNKDDLIKSLPLNCNFHMKHLIEKFNPTYTLARYAAELDIPINEVIAEIFEIFLFSCNFYLFLL